MDDIKYFIDKMYKNRENVEEFNKCYKRLKLLLDALIIYKLIK
jgi:hypothetical protein